MKAGRWSIIKYRNDTYHDLFHRCLKDSESQNAIYYQKRWPNRSLEWSCEACGEKPPEGILCAYILLEMDFCQDQIDSAERRRI